MLDRIIDQLKDANSMIEVEDNLLNLFKNLKKENPTVKIAYVAGMVTSEGPQNIAKNIAILHAHTAEIANLHPDLFVFSATYVFTDDLFKRLDAAGYKNEDWIKFWKDIHTSGLVDVMFMTPRWQMSSGSQDEFNSARQMNMPVFDVNVDQAGNYTFTQM